jgi:uncharacterized alkaline shock family protein YloU
VLHPESKRGVQVHIDEDQIVIDLYVVIEYGVRIATVARNIISGVKFNVEKAMEVPITSVNVHVQGLHVSDRDIREKRASSAQARRPRAKDRA